MGLPCRHALEAKRASLREKRAQRRKLTNEAKLTSPLRKRKESLTNPLFSLCADCPPRLVRRNGVNNKRL